MSVHPLTNVIVRDGSEFPVEPRVMELLVYLAARPGKVVSKGELMESVWNAHVVDEAVHRAVSLLRSALGDSPRRSSIVETVPRRGYRLLVRPAPLAGSGWLAGKVPLIAAAAAAAMLVLSFLIGSQVTQPPATTSTSVSPRTSSLPALPVAQPEITQPGKTAADALPTAGTKAKRAALQPVVEAPTLEQPRPPIDSTTPKAAPNWAPSAPQPAPSETPSPPRMAAPAPAVR